MSVFPFPFPFPFAQVVSTAVATALLWGFVIWGLRTPREMFKEANEWKTWISNNFSWFYIAAFVSQPRPRFKLQRLFPRHNIFS